MIKRRILLGSLLAIAAALPVVTPRPADARVFVGVGLGFPAFGFGFPYYPPYYQPLCTVLLSRYYPPPAYYYPPPPAYGPPPAAYGAPPAGYGTAPTGDEGPSAIARCVTPTVICPLRYVEPVGTACSCRSKSGGYVSGRAG